MQNALLVILLPSNLCSLYIPLFNGWQKFFHHGLNRRGVKLTTHLYLVQRLRMNGAIHPLSHFSWRVA
jgi:hypothetical protein